jgi:hypothetical protein
MQQSWASFEGKVRAVASHIWNGNCEPSKIGGVDLDGALFLSDDVQIFIEMTEQRDLNKVREDVVKLQTARAAYLAENSSYARCYCVVNGTVTQGMIAAGKPHRIQVLSFANFAAIFFDFDKYRFARENAAFSSAINPLTGAKDIIDYVPVKYRVDESGKEIGSHDIAQMIRHGRRVVLLGEYGTGKSRCTREVFKELAATAVPDNIYPLALNLREFWGLRRASELLTRHVAELGLDSTIQTAAMRALNAERVVLLLDGFDELGSQSWSNDSEKLRVIRAKSLEGVRDLIMRAKGGVLVCGREHYFNSNSEMFSSLGMEADSMRASRSHSILMK